MCRHSHRDNSIILRPALGSQYSVIAKLLSANWSHFGSSNPILYSTQSQPCRPLQSKLTAFGDKTSAKSIHTDQAVVTCSRGAGSTARTGVWSCLK